MQAKVNHASALINEDYLKHVKTRTGGQAFYTQNNKHLPRAQHSVFGDFPKDYCPKKSDKVEPLAPLDQNELSVAAKQTGKLTFQLLTTIPKCPFQFNLNLFLSTNSHYQSARQKELSWGLELRDKQASLGYRYD